MSIKHAILGLLSWKPSTGYELKKIFEGSSTMHWSGNNNQIYKALVQLLDEELVTNETFHTDGSPSKKVYSITEDGLCSLKTWVMEESEASELKKPFLIHLAWADLLSDEELLQLLEKYEDQINVQLLYEKEKIKRGIATPCRTPREAFLWEKISENTLLSLETELTWLLNVKHGLKKKENPMTYRIVKNTENHYIEYIALANPIKTEQDALELVSLCVEHSIYLLMLHKEALPEEFFDLKTGLAGGVIQKFVNYNIRVAAVIPFEKAQRGKFKNMISEANKGNHFRIFETPDDAEKWLVK